MRGGSWVFVTVPPDLSEAVRAIPRPPSPGFGSVKVNATIGGSRWSTSIFPESESRCYVLPVKRPIRTAEGVDVGDAVAVRFDLAE
jgi:hypothetical protein